MKNLLKSRFYVIVILISFDFLNPLFAQTITVTESNGTVKIEAKLDPGSPITNTAPDYETSVGFFYRLENINTHQSYFWPGTTIKDDAIDSNEKITETLYLPPGTYTIIAYESRKSKPIRTTTLSGISNTFTINSSPYQFPTINLGASELQLYSSWNIYWHQFPPYTNTPVHYTEPIINPEYLPAVTEPWVFMTLVKKNWMINAPIRIEFPDFLSFEGAISRNQMHKNQISKNITLSVNPNIAGQPQSLSISNNGLPSNEQVIIHLIFKKNVNYIPSETYPETTSFRAFYYIQTSPPSVDSILFDTTFVFKPKPKPHDPNRLTVDKKELCECGFDEYLTYRIDYQNDGNAPTDTVLVTLMDLNHLQPATIQHNNHTDGFMAPINYNLSSPLQNNEFLIKYPNGLPGLRQNSTAHPKVSAEACQDYFYIRVKKEDCLSAGEKIQPKAMITFAGTKDTIYTNLDETLIVARSKCNSCPPPSPRCPNCPKKKPCWLFSWLRPKNNN